MIFTVVYNCKGAVDLLCQHNSCKLVGESHFRHAHFKLRHIFDFIRKPVGAADNKDNIAFSAYSGFIQLLCEFLAGKLLALCTLR